MFHLPRSPFPWLLILLGVTPLVVHAHETWLAPVTIAGAPARSVTFDLTSGGKFPTLDYAIAPDRIAAAKSRLGATLFELTRVRREKHSFRFSQSFPRDGVVTAWVTLFPKSIELKRATIVEYLDEINASRSVREAWAALEARQPWKESYTKHAKTCVAVGDVGADDSWKAPVGQALEIVPQTNPFGLRPKEQATFRLLANGRPLANAAIGLIAEGSEHRNFQTTDAEGNASFAIERAGRNLVFAVHLRLRADGKTWESDFATLTLEVKRE